MNPKILVTGASGFIGQAVTKALLRAAYPVVATIRQPSLPPFAVEINGCGRLHWGMVGSINGHTAWNETLQGVSTVVHCAARAHISNDQAPDTVSAYREVNVAGTLNLAQQAIAAGVGRFIFLSSIGVNGKQSTKPFTETDTPNPQDAYAASKLEAEQLLLTLALKSETEFVIIRPPLVYGPSAPGNFGRLVRFVQSGWPMPLGAIHNRRSLVGIDNLVSLILLCADRAQSRPAANEVFVVADSEDVSTATLVRKIAQAAGCFNRMLPIPATFLRATASMLGKETLALSLLGDLQVNASKATTLLGWRPLLNLDQQLALIFNQNSNFKK